MAKTRKRKYKREFCKQLIDHMSQGFSLRAFAASVDVHHSTIYEWLKKHEEFAEAKELGLDKSRLFWERVGIDLATGEVRGSAKVWEINMYNRFRDEWTRDNPDKEDKSNEININLKYDPRGE